MSDSGSSKPPSLAARALHRIGTPVVQALDFVGDTSALAGEVSRWLHRSATSERVRFGWTAFYQQLVRVAIQSVSIIVLVSA